MRKILSDLDCKLYYDLEDFTFHWNSGVGTGQEYTKEVINLLKKSFQV